MIDGLKDRSERFERRRDALRSLIERIMDAANISKAELPEATFSFRALPSSVVIIDDTILPPDMIRTKYEPDKAKIRERLKDGANVPGAMLTNGGRSLSIRVK